MQAGALSVSGALTRETAVQQLAGLRSAIRSQPAGARVVCDLSGLGPVDTAGLAALLLARREAALTGRSLDLQTAPADLLALARLSSVDSLFSAAR